MNKSSLKNRELRIKKAVASERLEKKQKKKMQKLNESNAMRRI